MLFVDTTPLQVVLVVLTSIIGLFGVAAGLNGYLFRPIHPIIRVALIAAGLLMLDPTVLTDIVGIVIMAAAFVFQYLGSKKASAA